jgi:hypothetical protein
MVAGRLHEQFIAVPGGTKYVAKVVVGLDTPVVRWLNPILRKVAGFSDASGMRWFRHNVEEVGNLQFFLPQLYRERTGAAATQAA